MDPELDRSQRSRENLLAISLTTIAGGILLFFLYIISLGIIGNVLGVGVLIIMLGVLHYLVWGRTFSAEVAAEREALRRQDARDDMPRSSVPADAIQDLARTQGIKK